MFKFLGFGRNSNSNKGTPARDGNSSPAGLTVQHTDIQRELVRVVLKDVMRHHGVPSAWLGCEVTVMSRKSQNQDLLVHLVVMRWSEALLRYAPVLQQQLLEGLDRFDPGVDHSKYIVSWRFSPVCGCPQVRMPNPQFWLAADAPVAPVLAPVATLTSPARPTPTPAPAAASAQIQAAAPAVVKPKFDLPKSEMDNMPSGFAPTEPSPLNER
jgi:hypothetical protein